MAPPLALCMVYNAVVLGLGTTNIQSVGGGEMEGAIAKLLEDYEQGRMTRRQLIKGLSCLAAVSGSAGSVLSGVRGSVSAAGSKKMRAVTVNHISYQVNDYTKTRDFYANLLGMRVVGDTGSQCFLVLGDSNTFVIPRNARQGSTSPRIDHIAYTIEDWDKNAVKAELERRGLKPEADTDNSFHVQDPNGFDLQICGKEMKPE